MGLLRQVWGPAVARAREEIAEMQEIAAAEGSNEPLEAWDYRHYAEKLRQAKYDLSDEAVKPYLQLDKLREAHVLGRGRALRPRVHQGRRRCRSITRTSTSSR